MHEKVGVKNHCLTPLSKKSGSVDLLDPVLSRSMIISSKRHSPILRACARRVQSY